MRTRSVCRRALLLSCGFQVAAARLLHSLPEDTYAFPKYRVSFLNGLPVLKDTADRWLKEGLRGGESEFLDQPWKDGGAHSPSELKGIGNGDNQEPGQPDFSKSSNVTLEHMKMGPHDAFLCLIPPAPESPSQLLDEQEEDATPAQSWSLLQPLSGKCLYHRQPWFTYSYCHNQEIRQFRELPHSGTVPPGGYEPTEDPDWESYTLGRAPPVPEPGVDLTVAQESAVAANLELARGAGSRYLVQRWGDGTMCDKTGKHREVEVQFHCSMTMTDTILLVREAKTCSYVLVIHTPRLCGEPGFKSRSESRDEAYIRCREIVESVDTTTRTENGPLAESHHPLNKIPPRKPLLPLPPKRVATDPKADAPKGAAKTYQERLRKTLEAMAGTGVLGDRPQVIVEQVDMTGDDEDLVFEFDVDDLGRLDDHDQGAGEHPSLVEALRAAGFDIKGEKLSDKKGKKKPREEEEEDEPVARDEL